MSEEWKNILEESPDKDLPCEYKIEVRCRGWYRPNGEEHRFASDERHPPTAFLTGWKHWEEGEPWEEGMLLVREHRLQKEKEAQENQESPPEQENKEIPSTEEINDSQEISENQ